MAERTGTMYPDILGFGSGSVSLSGRDGNVNPLQMVSLSKRATLQGSALTWGVLSSFRKKWGPDTTAIYTSVQDGYSYVWNADTGTFTVTDDTGGVVTYTGSYTLKELAVSWGVLKSSLYWMLATDSTNGDVFLIGDRQTNTKTAIAIRYDRSVNDFLAKGTQHVVFGRLTGRSSVLGAEEDSEYGDEPGTVGLVDAYSGGEPARPLLLSRAQLLEIDALYPLDMLKGSTSLSAARQAKIRAGLLYMDFSYLMIAMFAQNLLSASEKVIYEPWMIYSVFQWYYNVAHSTSTNRKIFDLSPRWG